MTKPTNAKPKWYSIRLRILDMSSRQLAAISLSSLFITIVFLVLAQHLPPADRPVFLRGAIPIFFGVFLPNTGVWIYKKFKPDSPGFKGYTHKRFFLESAYSIIIITGILGTWTTLYLAGYPNTEIAQGFAVAGFLLLLLTLILYLFFRVKNLRS
jgi:hypothetical protein